MKPVHIGAKLGEIAPTVIMPGDPLRAKFIAEKYLVDYKLVNKVRNMYAYTGYYKGKLVTVMGSGMGCPSMGIYAYELYKFYNVENIIRVGSCGSFNKEIDLLDVVLVKSSYSNSNFAYLFNGCRDKLIPSNKYLDKLILSSAKKLKYKLHYGNILTTDAFDYYVDFDKMYRELPKEINLLGAEMESFALFHTANILGRKAACLLTVVDSRHVNKVVTPKEREKSLTAMIQIALETSLEL